MQAGNDRYDLERAEQQVREKARAHVRFEQISNKRKADETEGLALDVDETPSSPSESESTDGSSLAVTQPPLGSTMDHAVSGREHVLAVDRGATTGHGHEHPDQSTKLKGKVAKNGKAEKKKRKKRKVVKGTEELKG